MKQGTETVEGMAKESGKLIAKNKIAYHEYFIEETLEAGIELFGTEVKSVRAGRVNLKDSFAYIKNNEVFVANMHISPYEKGNIANKDPLSCAKTSVKQTGNPQIKGSNAEGWIHLDSHGLAFQPRVCQNVAGYRKRKEALRQTGRTGGERRETKDRTRRKNLSITWGRKGFDGDI